MNSQWISKEEAGVRLNPERPLSPRRVLELAKEGKLSSELVRDPNNGQMVTRINAGSVEKYIYDRDTPAPIPDPAARPRGEVSAPRTSSHALQKRETQLLELVCEMVRGGCADRTAARLWLTVTESAAYSGLPAPVLVDFIAQGKLAAMDVGRRRGGRWRIRRVDLEGFSG